MAHKFDLRVLSARKEQGPVFPHAEVARAVHRFTEPGIQRILHKDLGRELRTIVVAQRQAASRHADLAGPPFLPDRLAAVEQEYIAVGKRPADRDLLQHLVRALHDMVSTVAGDLRRAIEVHEPCLRDGLHPVLQRLRRHDLAREHDIFQIQRAQRLEGMKAGKDLQGGHRPDDRVYAAFVEPLEKQLWEGKQLLLQDLKPPADTKREEDILNRDIKVKRCLIAPDSAVSKVEGTHKLLHHVDHRAVTDGNALRLARGTGGENNV